ncbi:hypothetical protein [Sulfitobacter pontiacus]|uniref:hypothetical protein n=1 Tax=Sulfitobacter pontiacus TaxID=60137 RepID=UPI0034633FAD
MQSVTYRRTAVYKYYCSNRQEIDELITEAVLEQAHNDLKHRVAVLNDVQFENVIRLNFSFEEIRAGFGRGAISAQIRPLLREGPGSAAIYRLTVNNQAGANRLRHAFFGYEPRDGHNLARNNDVNDSTTVYVGSSQKIGQRLQQHLHTCARGTYALKMHLWCPNAVNHIAVEIAVVRGNIQAALLQDIEDALWRSSRPMFGKIGPR